MTDRLTVENLTKATRHLGRRIKKKLAPTRERVTVTRSTWAADAQEGEFQFHATNRWRETEDFVRQTAALFHHFGFEPSSFDGKIVIDVGAGSRLRTKFFTGAHLIAIEPLADRFMSEIAWCDLSSADEVYSVPAEDRVQECVGRADLVVSLNVLDHCFDVETIVGNLKAYANDDGIILLSFDMHEEADEMHPLCLTPEICEDIFRRAGLSVLRTSTGLGDALGGAQTYGHGPYALNYWLTSGENR